MMTSDGRPPDQPPVPTIGTSMLTKVWGSVIVAALGFYGVAQVMGWDFGPTERDEIPSTVRSSPGGYRTFHFWHSGYHGGK